MIVFIVSEPLPRCIFNALPQNLLTCGNNSLYCQVREVSELTFKQIVWSRR
jgi:hypothetical protein